MTRLHRSIFLKRLASEEQNRRYVLARKIGRTANEQAQEAVAQGKDSCDPGRQLTDLAQA